VETDGTLIERSCRGRPDAFVEVVRRHEVAVHGFLARRAGPQAAADLLGEVWVRAFAGREVLLLVAWEQLTPAEAAAVLGVPPGTARSRLHRARAALRLALQEAT